MGHTLSSIPNLLERGSLTHEEPRLNASQWGMDGSLSNFAEQAANPYLISSFMIGQSAKRLFDFVTSPVAQSLLGTSALRASAAWTSRVSLGIYKMLRLGSEAAAFEIGHRSLQVGFQGANSSLLAWNGSHGLRNGLIHSSLNFCTLHGIGKIAAGENIVFQHFLQSTGIVAANQMAAAIDLLPSSNQNLVAQLFEAEIFNIQQQGTAQLSPTNHRAHQSDLQLYLNLTPSPATTSKISLQSKRLPLLLAMPEMRSEGDTPTSLSEQITTISLEAWTSYERGIRAAKEGVELFVGALNLRIATGPQRPFLLETSIEGALHQHFGIVRESAEAIRAMEAPFERLLFAIRGQGNALPEGFATMKRNIRSQRETLEGQASSWQDIFEPTLKTAALNESHYQKVQGALAKFFNPELGFGVLELFPFLPGIFAKALRPSEGVKVSLPPSLETKIWRWNFGWRAEEMTAHSLTTQILGKYIQLLNQWLGENPSQALAASLSHTQALLRDARNMLSFLEQRIQEGQSLKFDFSRERIPETSEYQDSYKALVSSKNRHVEDLDWIESELIPLLQAPSFTEAQYKQILAKLEGRALQRAWSLPRLIPYPR